MTHPRTVGVVTAISAIAVTAAVSAQAAPTSVVDRTYSCKVRPQHYIDLNTSVTLPPTQDAPQRPANLNLFTVKKTFKKNGFNFNLPQVFFRAAKGSNLKIDTPTCRRSSRKAVLRPTGLPSHAETVTPQYLGFFAERCVTAKRVLVHLRITLSGGVPVSALAAVRNDNETRLPVEFINWKPRNIKGYFSKRCVSTANG
jgi:hypothetical protein